MLLPSSLRTSALVAAVISNDHAVCVSCIMHCLSHVKCARVSRTKVCGLICKYIFSIVNFYFLGELGVYEMDLLSQWHRYVDACEYKCNTTCDYQIRNLKYVQSFTGLKGIKSNAAIQENSKQIMQQNNFYL